MPGGIRRRKIVRSGISDKIKRRARKEKAKRHVYGNSIIEKNWDPKLTVQQNYKKLGLASNLQKATGGVEKPENESTEIKVRAPKVPLAKITKDKDGVVRVEYESEDDIDDPFEPVEGRTEIVKQLEEMARNGRQQTVRHQSQEESAWLEKLVAKYGDNFDAMQWNKKLNPFQHSAGELRRRVKKMRK